jgi:hypothetical protein
MTKLRRRWSLSFAIGLAVFFLCLVYIPQWRSYAPRLDESTPHAPYLTPWTVLSVTALSLALAVTAFPARSVSPIRIIVSKTLGVVVLCFATIFLVEYISGIHMPDLDVFFLPDAISHRITLYSARPSAYSASTSLFFALALLLYHRDVRWRLRSFQVGTFIAMALPSISALGYIARFCLDTRQPSWLASGLSIPAVMLYFTLGSGFLGLCFRPRQVRPSGVRTGKHFWRWV